MSFKDDFQAALTAAGFPDHDPEPFAITQAYRDEVPGSTNPDAGLARWANRIAIAYVCKLSLNANPEASVIVSKGDSFIVCTSTDSANQITANRPSGALS